MELVHSGKVRELYSDGDDLIMVASDRVSIYDVVLPTARAGLATAVVLAMARGIGETYLDKTVYLDTIAAFLDGQQG